MADFMYTSTLGLIHGRDDLGTTWRMPADKFLARIQGVPADVEFYEFLREHPNEWVTYAGPPVCMSNPTTTKKES